MEALAALEVEVNALIGVVLPAVEQYGRWRQLQVRASRVSTSLVRIKVGALESEQLEHAGYTKRLATITTTIDAQLQHAASRLELHHKS